MNVERTDFVGIPVTDRDRAIEFYGGALGLRRNELAHPEWPEFETGNVTILLNTPEQTGVPFEAKGVTFFNEEPYESGVCKMAFFKDPDGNSLILHNRHAPCADGSQP